MTTVLIAACLLFGAIAATWWWLRARLYHPPGAKEAEAAACAALGIRRPLVQWQRGDSFRFGRTRVVGAWSPGVLTIAKADGQPFSMTAFAFELSREARLQLEHVRDESEPPNESPRLLELTAKARAALSAWEQKGSP